MRLRRGVIRSLLAAGGAMVLGACATRPPAGPMPEHRFDAPVPVSTPDRGAVTPQLVAYPGIDVAYVANADGETYRYRGIYYTFFDGDWFRARSLRGPWSFIEMKYVPSDLFRVRGHRPPTLALSAADRG